MFKKSLATIGAAVIASAILSAPSAFAACGAGYQAYGGTMNVCVDFNSKEKPLDLNGCSLEDKNAVVKLIYKLQMAEGDVQIKNKLIQLIEAEMNNSCGETTFEQEFLDTWSKVN